MSKKLYTLTLRLDDDTGKIFTAIASLNGVSATEILRDCVNKYIDENQAAAAAAILNKVGKKS